MILCSIKFITNKQIIVALVFYFEIDFTVAFNNFKCFFFNKMNFQSFALIPWIMLKMTQFGN